jgi:hypothetical protein
VVTGTVEIKKTKQKTKKPALSLLLGCKFLSLGVMASFVCGSWNVMWWPAKLQQPSKKNPAV